MYKCGPCRTELLCSSILILEIVKKTYFKDLGINRKFVFGVQSVHAYLVFLLFGCVLKNICIQGVGLVPSVISRLELWNIIATVEVKVLLWK